jgi:MoaA/NifB/PqqE/SkfB family radical SAM enzyme
MDINESTLQVMFQFNCEEGNLKQVKHIVEELGYPVREKGMKTFCTVCGKRNCIDVVKYLLSKGCSVSYKNHYPMQRALDTNNSEMIKLIHEHGGRILNLEEYKKYEKRNYSEEVKQLIKKLLREEKIKWLL